MLHSQFVPLIVVTMLQNWLGLGHAAFVQKSWLDCGKSLLHTKLGSHHVFFAAMLHSQFVPHIVATVPQNCLGLGHAAFVQKSWLDCGKSLLHTKLGPHHVFFAAMLHSQFVPTLWSQCSKAGSVLAMQILCRSHDWTVVNHYCTQNWGLTVCFLRQCCTHSLCPTLWPLCPKTGSVLAMQPLCRSHGWTVVNHYYTQNWGLTMCFLRQCCTHSLCPSLWSQCSKTGSVLAMQPLCRSHGWTVVNHYYTQNSGLTVFFAAMLHSQFVPHIVVTMLQNWLGLGHTSFVQKSWLDCGKALLHTKLGSHRVCFAAMLHSQFVPHIVATVPQNWLGLGHAAFVQKSWLDCGKSLLHTELGSNHVFIASMLHAQFVPLIVVTMLQNWLGLGHAAFVQKSWLDCGKSLLHTKLGSHHVFFAAMLHSQFVPHIVATVPQNWLGLGHAAFVQKSWLDCGKSLLHTKLGPHHVFFAAMLHSQFVSHIVVTMLQSWLGLGHADFVQKS